MFVNFPGDIPEEPIGNMPCITRFNTHTPKKCLTVHKKRLIWTVLEPITFLVGINDINDDTGAKSYTNIYWRCQNNNKKSEELM